MLKSTRLNERNRGNETLNFALKDRNKVLIIHYSCESFITSHGRTPRVTSISVGNFVTTQIKSFSIHLQAQISGLDFNDLLDSDYDELEKAMLQAFYKYVKTHKSHTWVHWKMRDSNYGFEAIDNRMKILKGRPVSIDEDRKIDLSEVIGLLYGWNYEVHSPKGKLLNLAERNNITTLDALGGAEEAEKYEKKQYLELHRSTLRKVCIIQTLLAEIENNNLKVNSSTREVYGLTPNGIAEVIKNSWLLTLIYSLLIFCIGAAMEPIIQKLFGTN